MLGIIDVSPWFAILPWLPIAPRLDERLPYCHRDAAYYLYDSADAHGGYYAIPANYGNDLSNGFWSRVKDGFNHIYSGMRYMVPST